MITELITWLSFWLSNFDLTIDVDRLQWYQLGRSQVPYTPPSILFSCSWPLLYALLIAACTHYTVNRVGDQFYIVVHILFAASGLMNRYWFHVFFRRRAFRVALLILIALGVTIITNVVLLGISSFYLEMALIAPYAAWIVFVTYLNWRWIYVVISRTMPTLPFSRPKKNGGIPSH